MELELLHRRILDSSLMEILVLDKDLNVMEANATLLQVTGKSSEELLGQPVEVVWEVRSIEKVKEDLTRDRTFQGEVVELSLGGDPRAVHYTITPFRNDIGQVAGFSGFGRPITDTDHFERELRQQLEELRKTQGAAMVGLAKLAETRDPETGQHLERMRNYTRLMSEELSTLPEYRLYITDDYIHDIYNSSPLHDIGKVGIPDAILLKPGRLTPQEFEIMKKHAPIGGDALRAADHDLDGESFLTLGKEIAYHHHEKWDGTGYPDGLQGMDIPLSARIVALADVYDALTSKRVYKEAIAHDQARAIIIDSAGSHFAEDVVRAFLKRENDFLKIKDEFRD
ncbi:HD domain-containing protein [bacterium]|nr:HD domain-containing protein [bacterium]MBU1650929.1 HD domain-containing protein [bacterium]